MEFKNVELKVQYHFELEGKSSVVSNERGSRSVASNSKGVQFSDVELEHVGRVR